EQHYLQGTSDHNHAPEASRFGVVKTINTIKGNAREADDLPSQIIQSTISNTANSQESIEDITIPENMKVTLDGVNFLVKDSTIGENRILLFTTQKASMHRTKNQQTPDPIAPHSERLVLYMNTHPNTLLGYAKYYGGYSNAISARMTDINSIGFVMLVKTDNDKESEVNIRYKHQLGSCDQVRPMLTQMANECEEALGLSNTRPPLPNHTPFNPPSPLRCFSVLSLIGLNILLAYYPGPLPNFLESIRSFFGYDFIKLFVYFTIVIHAIEALVVAIILYIRGEPDLSTSIKWVLMTAILGHFWQIFIPTKRKNN
ncbi:6159_t:CDS:2, partial [Entrophospora sp. SA101]